jgi:hypothetical protein
MDSEEIFINLKVLESLDKNQKLISRGKFLNIEPVSIIPEFIRRWHRQDNRDETIKKINLIVNSAIDIIKEQESKDNSESSDSMDPNTDHNVRNYLERSLNGIKNLKETYATCSQTCARLDVIINKINFVLRE